MLSDRNNFKKISKDYEKNAIVQKNMAQDLINCLSLKVGSYYENILEIGCGTGLLTKLIYRHISYLKLTLNDINRFVDFDNHEYEFLVGDIEDIDLPSDRYDLVISNAVFQWVKDLESLFKKICISLKKRGILAFTTFGSDNLKQIKDITGVGLSYFNLNGYVELLKNDFNLVYVSESREDLYFNDPVEILRHMKLTGVNNIKKIHWTKRDLKGFVDGYSKFKTERGYLLTYHPICFIVEKKTGVGNDF
ncbi:MAG: malonyl-ACP O-methyltransferase BioC [Calditerrivibrio sp.]|nr:malonyl-ACP O-methyltransferase BioC [Calditerrivibrio sp.]